MHFLLNYALLNTPMWYGKYVIILSALEGCSKSSFKASKLLKLFILIEPYLVIGDTVRGIQLKKKKNYPTSTRRHGNFAGVHTLLRILLSSNSAVLINIITGVLPPHFDFVVYYVLCQC
jgi:hypothetical protein